MTLKTIRKIRKKRRLGKEKYMQGMMQEHML